MQRRAFIGSLAAAFTLDPERALWTPGKKLISIPAWPTPHAVEYHVEHYAYSRDGLLYRVSFHPVAFTLVYPQWAAIGSLPDKTS